MNKNVGPRQAPDKKTPSGTPRILHLDFETRSRADLPKVGAHRYAYDESTEVLCAAYAVDDGPVQLWVPGDPVPPEVIEAARADGWVIAAHNASFERVIAKHVLTPRHKWPEIQIAKWRCTMAQAYACALPGKLENVAAALELPHQKDPEGAQFIRLLSKPCKDGAWNDDPELLRRLCTYCQLDVTVERDLHHALPELLPDEQLIWQIDQAINDRGFHTHGELLEAASRVVAESNSRLLTEFNQLTGLESPAQVAKLISWLAEHGCEVPDLQKGTLAHALRRKGLGAEVRRAIEIRKAVAPAGAAKVGALLDWRMDDSRVRGTLTYHGAATGRWIGRGPQPQNFKRDGDRIAETIGAVLAGGDGLESPIEAVANITRAMITAAPGRRLMIADFSGIESRVLAWIAGERSKLAMWEKFDLTQAEADDPYFIGGRQIGHPEETARASGKIADLAFGYQGGANAWKNFAPADDASDEQTIERYRDAWRAAHPATVRFWYGADRAAIKAVQQPGVECRAGRVTFHYDPPFLRATLPAGRSIAYPFPRLELNRFGRACVMFKDSAGGKFTDVKFGQGAYGGLWTENIVSGIARDLLAAALVRLEAAGYPVVLHIHDEILVEVPIGIGSIEEFRSIVEMAPAWAESLPIRAKARESLRFSKEDNGGANIGAAVEHQVFDDHGDHRHDAADDAADGAGPAGAAPEESVSPRKPWSKPTIGEPPPGSPEFEAIFATLSPEDQKIARHRPAATQANGGGAPPGAEACGEPQGNGQAWENTGRNGDGYPHGEHDTEGHGAGRQPVYIYRDARGEPYLGVKRTSGKQFPQFHWDGAHWLKGKPKGPKIPYRLPELLDAPLDAWALICAGEKDAETAASLGFVATTNSEGESPGKWTPDLNAWFVGRKHIAVMEDNDATGRAHAIEVVGAMRSINAHDVRVVTFRELAEHGDLSDWIEQGHGKEDLQARIEAAQPAEPEISILSKAEFLRGFVPPDYLIEGILQRRFIYSLTGQTGHAKTAIALRVAQLVDCGGMLDGHEIARGRVAYLVGENPDDVRMRVIGDDAVLGNGGNGNIIFVPGVFNTDALLRKVESLGELDLVIIDTSAAYFLGDDENSNPQLGDHARKLRRLIGLPGGPCGLVLCHPIKHAVEPAQLLPRGGGAFTAEVDGNMTAWKDGNLITLHHSDKWRGPGFEPITFRLDRVEVNELQDSKGRTMPTVRAVAISDDEEEQEASAKRDEENQVMVARLDGGHSMSIADLARALGWEFADGRPYKSKVQRVLHRLKAAGMMKASRGDWDLTDKGEETAKKLKKGTASGGQTAAGGRTT